MTYQILIHGQALKNAAQYLQSLLGGTEPGAYLAGELARISHQLPAAADDAPHPAAFSRIGMLDGQSSTTPRPSGRKHRWVRCLPALATKPSEKCELKKTTLQELTATGLLGALLKTKRPQIYAEGQVRGDGSDWNAEELSILGDVSVAASVKVFDNGGHHNPIIHPKPFRATLLFTPGALLRNGYGHAPADWHEVVAEGSINSAAYQRLYERRLLPVLLHADKAARKAGRKALVTVPGLGCGQFAGPFAGMLGEELKNALRWILQRHATELSAIEAVYFDPYSECENERYEIGKIVLLVRPLTKGNSGKSQMCLPATYTEDGHDFSDCLLFSIVAWDHVSWPGNDFFIGSRATDDGVKAAATDVMTAMTSVPGRYCSQSFCYQPPEPYSTWLDVVNANSITFHAGRLLVYAAETG